MNEQTSRLFSIIENRIQYKRPTELTALLMMQSVKKYYSTLKPECWTASAKLTFFTEATENKKTIRYGIHYISGTNNTDIIIYSDDTHRIKIKKDVISYYRLAYILGFDFFKNQDAIDVYLYLNFLDLRNCLDQTAKKQKEKLLSRYKGKDVIDITEYIFPKLYDFMEEYNLKIKQKNHGHE